MVDSTQNYITKFSPSIFISQLPRVFSWRVGLVSIAVYGGLYTWKWSHYEPEKSVKEQVKKDGCK